MTYTIFTFPDYLNIETGLPTVPNVGDLVRFEGNTLKTAKGTYNTNLETYKVRLREFRLSDGKKYANNSPLGVIVLHCEKLS